MLNSERQLRIDKEGSQYFPFLNPEPIPPGDIVALDYEDIDPQMLRYHPVDYCKAINISRADILLSISPSQNFLIPAKSSFAIQDRSITQIRIKNLSTIESVGKKEVNLIFQKLPLTEDRLIRRKI